LPPASSGPRLTATPLPLATVGAITSGKDFHLPSQCSCWAYKEEDFEESLDFVRSIGFARLHVFPFSPRPATAAWRMDSPVLESQKRRWGARARQVAEEGSLQFRSRFIGREVRALWESSPHPEPEGWHWKGLTGNFLRVEVISRQTLVNRITRARLVALTPDGLLGELLA
jgi:threonylcarbamoyladenosine tRNA methylthiotransferase MtaB